MIGKHFGKLQVLRIRRSHLSIYRDYDEFTGIPWNSSYQRGLLSEPALRGDAGCLAPRAGLRPEGREPTPCNSWEPLEIAIQVLDA